MSSPLIQHKPQPQSQSSSSHKVPLQPLPSKAVHDPDSTSSDFQSEVRGPAPCPSSRRALDRPDPNLCRQPFEVCVLHLQKLARSLFLRLWVFPRLFGPSHLRVFSDVQSVDYGEQKGYTLAGDLDDFAYADSLAVVDFSR